VLRELLKQLKFEIVEVAPLEPAIPFKIEKIKKIIEDCQENPVGLPQG